MGSMPIGSGFGTEDSYNTKKKIKELKKVVVVGACMSGIILYP
jgi:hypothetical protein